jgi:hypothetical protein
MASDGSRHCRGISLPERGAALDVSEEEGDGARWKIDHCPSFRSCTRAVIPKLSHGASPAHGSYVNPFPAHLLGGVDVERRSGEVGAMSVRQFARNRIAALYDLFFSLGGETPSPSPGRW